MDEDGVDAVEAIDAWIDEQIDDLSDEELERILEILDVVAASRFAYIDSTDIDSVDIDTLVDLVGGSAASRSRSEEVLSAALLYESTSSPHDTDSVDSRGDDLFSVFPDEPVDDQLFVAGDDEQPDTDDEAPDLFVVDGGAPAIFQANDAGDGHADDEDADDEDGDDEDGDDYEDEGTAEADDIDDGHDRYSVPIVTLDALNADEEFLIDLAHAERTDELAAIDVARYERDPTASIDSASPAARRPLPLPLWAANAQPADLRDHDALGPSFLDEPDSGVLPPSGLRHFMLPLFMVLGLAAFGFGMLRLVGSLDDDTTDVAAASSELDAVTNPTASPEPTEIAATSAPVDSADAAPTPTPTAPPPPRFAIRLVTGDVMVATYVAAGQPATLSEVYDVDDDDHSPAREVEWGDVGLTIVDDEGDVLVIDPDASQSSRVVFEANDEVGEAVEIAIVTDHLAIRTELGNIVMVDTGAGSDPTDIDLVWDAQDEGTKVTNISSIGELVPFVLDNGDARMIITDSENSIIEIWVAGDQPPAYNVEGTSSGILLGVGQGAVARYLVGDIEGNRYQTVWDPFETDEQPAIGYSSVGDRTAIVLADGAIVLADDTGTGPRIWEPADTELRAFIAAGGRTAVVVLLETGSVVRIPVGSNEPIESVWDITDETLRAANQIVLEPDRSNN